MIDSVISMVICEQFKYRDHIKFLYVPQGKSSSRTGSDSDADGTGATGATGATAGAAGATDGAAGATAGPALLSSLTSRLSHTHISNSGQFIYEKLLYNYYIVEICCKQWTDYALRREGKSTRQVKFKHIF